MKRTGKLLWAVVCCSVILGGLCGLGCKKQEPMYEGKPESYWIDLAKHPDSMKRRDAVVVLGKAPPDPARVVQVLEEALGDRDAAVRFETAKALGMMGSAAASAVPSLEVIAKADPKSYVRREATRAIGRIRKADGE